LSALKNSVTRCSWFTVKIDRRDLLNRGEHGFQKLVADNSPLPADELRREIGYRNFNVDIALDVRAQRAS
jgi:hypothetical protein